MFAPDQLGRDKLCLSLKLGRELLPETAVLPGFESAPAFFFWSSLVMVLQLNQGKTKLENQNRKTSSPFHS
jgi:hypothetical protein